MAKTITLEVFVKTNKTAVRRTKKWGDPFLVEKCGWTTRNVGSNFNPIMLTVFNTRNEPEFGGTHIFQRINETFLESLQYEQLDKSPQFGSIKNIMNWLINSVGLAGRPYWYINPDTPDKQLVFGSIVFGGQLVQVESDQNGNPIEHIRSGRYPNESDSQKRQLVFYKLQGIRKYHVDEWLRNGLDGRSYHPNFPHLIQHATSADVSGGVHDIYNEFPRGTEIFHPVWDARDYPHNKPTYDKSLYIAKDFLE